jgi:hypothetical protein
MTLETKDQVDSFVLIHDNEAYSVRKMKTQEAVKEATIRTFGRTDGLMGTPNWNNESEMFEITASNKKVGVIFEFLTQTEGEPHVFDIVLMVFAGKKQKAEEHILSAIHSFIASNADLEYQMTPRKLRNIFNLVVNEPDKV